MARRDHKGRFLPSKRTLNVVPLIGNELSNIDKALRHARQENFNEIVILGMDTSGAFKILFTDKKNTMTERDVVYMLELARVNLASGVEE